MTVLLFFLFQYPLQKKLFEVEWLNPSEWEAIDPNKPSIEIDRDKNFVLSNLQKKTGIKFKTYFYTALIIRTIAHFCINALIPPLGIIYHSVCCIFTSGNQRVQHFKKFGEELVNLNTFTFPFLLTSLELLLYQF